MNKILWLRRHIEDKLDYLGSLADTLTVKPEEDIFRLLNKHFGDTCYIIGKGPSLSNLRHRDIKSGPIITLNSAIRPIEALNLVNSTYAMMKDGGTLRSHYLPSYGHCSIRRPGCKSKCQETCGGICKPVSATLLVHKYESLHCYPDHKPRYVFAWDEWCLPGNTASAIIAIKIAKLFGCKEIVMVAFDSITTGDFREYGTNADSDYKEQHEYIFRMLRGIKHKFI